MKFRFYHCKKLKFMIKNLFIVFTSLLMLASCVSQKKYKGLQAENQLLKTAEENFKANLTDLKLQLSNATTKNAGLEDKIKLVQENVVMLQKLLDDCQKQNNQGGVNISKLVDEINASNQYIKQLIATNAKNDSLNRVLTNNLTRSLSDVSSDDIQIKVQKGVVFVSLSDKLLYRSGRYDLNPAANNVLAKIGQIVNDYKDYDILINGNTDNVPISTGSIKDNWDLSCLRATAVARYLQNDLKVDPARITAGGRSEYVPKASNETAAGKALNRRTEIIIMPKLDEFLKLLEEGGGKR